ANDRPYLGPGRDEAFTRLGDEIHGQDAVLFVTGAAGTGKTILLNAVLAETDHGAIRVIRLDRPDPGPRNRSWIMRQLPGVETSVSDVAELAARLTPATEERPAVIVADDAHDLTDDAMTFLLEIASPIRSERPPRIVLCGRDAYWERD